MMTTTTSTSILVPPATTTTAGPMGEPTVPEGDAFEVSQRYQGAQAARAGEGGARPVPGLAEVAIESVASNGVAGDVEVSVAQGEPLVLEYLDSAEVGARVVAPWIRNLQKLGVTLRFRPVDFALYQQRLRSFDFDIISLAFQGTHNPGSEYADIFGSEAAKTPDSGNYSGLANPAVDRIITRMVGAKTQPEFQAACRALDRAISHSHVLIPQWSASTHRMAYNAWRLQRPATMPPYASGEAWAIDTWWAAPPRQD